MALSRSGYLLSGSFALMVALVFTACSRKPNPILGRWTAKEQGGFFRLSNVEFTETEQITGAGERHKVRYEIKGDTVRVIPEGAFSRQCAMHGPDSLVCDVGEYVRVK